MIRRNGVIYLAGPIGGLTWEAATRWRANVASMLSPLTCLSPLRDTDDGRSLRSSHHVTDGGRLTNEGKDSAIPFEELFARDETDCCVLSNLVFFNYLGAKTLSVGTNSELSWCRALAIPRVVVIEDEGNPNLHPFLIPQFQNRFNNVADAVNFVRKRFRLQEYLAGSAA